MQQGRQDIDSGALSALRSSGTPYLVCFVIGFVLGGLSTFVVGTQAVFKGQSLAVLIPLAGSVASLAFWTAYQPRSTRGLRLLPLIGLLMLWVGATLRAVQQSSGFNYTAFLVPMLLAMLLLKPPSRDDVDLVGRVIGLVLASVALLATVYSFVSGKLMLQPVYEVDYTPVNELLGLTKRWVGPFEQENYAGPIAALVFLFALCQRGWYRWAMGLTAAWMVFASTSSTAVVGVAVGLLVLATTSRSAPWSLVSRRTRLLTSLLLVLALAAVALTRDPTFNARTTVWSSYWEVWQRNPLGGVGTLGVEEALRDGTIPLYWTHAHNWFLDVLVRYGVLGLVLILGISGLSLYLAGRAALRGPIWPLAVIVAFLTMGLMEVPGDWLTWNLPLLWLVLAVLATGDPPGSEHDRVVESGGSHGEPL